MELNREQIIKALECCANAYDCFTCNNYKRHCIGGFRTNIAQNALALIKELTEENERLSKEVKYREAEARADTAREILAEVENAWHTTYYEYEFEERLDNIEKKYTEEGK